MVDLGLVGCSQSFQTVYCVAKLIECIISLLMLAVVIFIMVRRVWKECQFNFYIAISVTMALTLTFISAFTINSQIKIFNFLYLYFYNAYFSIIVFKLALKLIEKHKQSKQHHIYKNLAVTIFVIFNILVLIALVYTIINGKQDCLQLPFLIANAFTLAVALLFIVLGVSHIKWQEENLDQSLPSNYQNNPLPRFKIWLVVNFVGQFMVLIQATIYEINHCKFSSNETTNQIMKLIFIFISYHTGMISTIFFFMHAAPNITTGDLTRKSSQTSSIGQAKIQIQLAYHQFDQIRTKMVSM